MSVFCPQLLNEQAGLFSAVLTAFVVETYQNLREDPSQTTNALLHQVTQLLSNSSTSTTTPESFYPTSSDIRVNVFWFISLVLSLASALFGIFVKQWLRSYMTWVDISPAQTAVTVRQFRYEGMIRWKLHEAVMGLPVLLQTALVLFMIGLVDFCFQLNRTLGGWLCTVASLCLIAILTSTFMPLISSTSPYRSPWSSTLAKMRLKLTKRLVETNWRTLSGTAEDYKVLEKILDCLARSISWNRLDQTSMVIEDLQPNSKSLSPSWEARGISHLLSSTQNANILMCVYRSRDSPFPTADSLHPTWKLDILDCWQVSAWFFGMENIDVRDQLDILRLCSNAVAMSPMMHKPLFSLMLQSLREWAASVDSTRNPQHSPDLHAGQVFTMMVCLLHTHPSLGHDAKLVVQCLDFSLWLHSGADRLARGHPTFGKGDVMFVLGTLYRSTGFAKLSPQELLDRWTFFGKHLGNYCVILH